MNLSDKQTVSAGQQFDGTEGKGKFTWEGDRSGINIKRIDLVMGSEDKSWQIKIVDTDGDVALLESGNGTISKVSLIGEIAIAPGQWIEVHTGGATSEMSCVVTWQDEPMRRS